MLFNKKSLNDRQATLVLIFAGFVCLILFISTLPLYMAYGHIVNSDGSHYFAITRSLFFDHDFHFANEYAMLIIAKHNAELTSLNIPGCPFAIGTPLLWMPFFLLAHGIAILMSLSGFSIPLNGFGYVYEGSVCVATIFYATIGFILTYRAILKVVGHNVFEVVLAVLAMWWATPAIYYMIAEPSMSHGMTIFSIALFLCLWYPPKLHRSVIEWVLLGIATGLVALVRWQDGIILVAPLAELISNLVRKNGFTPKNMLNCIVFFLSVALTFSPQLLMWKAVYGSYLLIPQGSDFLTWNHPQILAILFSTRHGLIAWNPIYFIALLGLVPLWKRDYKLTLVIGFMFLGELYVNSSATYWWAYDSFGGRRFTSLVPLFSIALSELVITLKNYRNSFIVVFCLLVVWNSLALLQFSMGLVSHSDALTLRQMTIERFMIPLKLFARFLR